MLLSRRIRTASTLISGPRASTRIQCQSFSSSISSRQKETPKTTPAPTALKDAPRSYGKQTTEEFTPKPLDRPIGLPHPPKAGENSPLDRRSISEKWEDFQNIEKNLAQRRKLTQDLSRPYFREWSNMRFHSGKSFLCPPSLFKRDRSLYFPNFVGQTLETTQELKDTTPLLQNKISIVSVYSSRWGENQIGTLISPEKNPALLQVLRENKDITQAVQVNVEENKLKMWVLRMLVPVLRKQVKEEGWGRYFIVRRSLEVEDRDAIGWLNGKVGYTYLVDGECRIRWACSGNAGEEEREGLVRGVRRLLEEEVRLERGGKGEGAKLKQQAVE